MIFKWSEPIEANSNYYSNRPTMQLPFATIALAIIQMTSAVRMDGV